MKSHKLSGDGRYLRYESHYSSQDIRTILSKSNLAGLSVFTTGMLNKPSKLDFLIDCVFLSGLEIITHEQYNLSVLHKLINLTELNLLVSTESNFDLSPLEKLKFLSVDCRNMNLSGFSELKWLTELCIADYLGKKNLAELSNLTSLKSLRLSNSSIKRLDGIENNEMIESLNFGACRSLESIEALRRFKHLKKIKFDCCSQTLDLEVLKFCTELERIEIVDTKICSIGFISSLPNLKEIFLVGRADVVDGDLRPAEKIDFVACNHRKHYNVKIVNEKSEQIHRKNMETISKLRS